MALSLDVITIGVPDVPEARAFYTSVLSPAVADHGDFVDLDLHGAGHLGLLSTDALAAEARAEPGTSGFRGHVVSYVVSQPSEVDGLHRAATDAGATVLKPAKKGFFGGYTGVVQAPDGSIWKVASGAKKDTGPAEVPPRPTETVVILGVADAKASKEFYEALGLSTDRDYGKKFVDFEVAPGTARLGLMPRDALAKDAGVDATGDGFPCLVLHHRAATRDEVDSLLETAAAAGGHVTVPAAEADWGGYSGHFADPDGFVWKVGTAS